MLYGRHDPGHYLEDNPQDARVSLAQEKLEELETHPWSSLPGEAPIDFKHRVEQAFHQLSDELCSDAMDRYEVRTAREEWVRTQKTAIEMGAHEGNTTQRHEGLRWGGGHDVFGQLEGLDREVAADTHQGLKDFTQDLTEKQAARREFITNHLVGPALEQKLEELGLDKVQEPERTPPQEPIKEPGKGSQILDDTMEQAAAARKDREADAALEIFNKGLEKIRSEERER